MSFNEEQQPNGVLPPPTQSQGFTFNQTMLRVKNPEASLRFYTGIMGMTLLYKDDYPDAKFSLYFLARLDSDEKPPEDIHARKHWTAKQRGILELTHNWGTEDQPDFHYHDGNSEPRGFGHICFSVPDLNSAIAFFDANNVIYQKRPEEGRMNNIAFIKDPDGYWIEIIQAFR